MGSAGASKCQRSLQRQVHHWDLCRSETYESPCGVVIIDPKLQGSSCCNSFQQLRGFGLQGLQGSGTAVLASAAASYH